MCRRLPAVFDRPPTTASNFLSYSSTLGGCPTKLSLVYFAGLFSRTAHLLILIAALKSRFTNSIRFSPSFVVPTNARSPRTFALPSICSSVSGPYFATSSGFRWHFSISTLWNVHPSSWCVYEAPSSSTVIVTRRRAHSLNVLVVGARVVPFFDAQLHAQYATTSLRLSFSFKELNSLKKSANACCFRQYRFARRKAHRGFVYSLRSASQ